jgi:hypothetical protein
LLRDNYRSIGIRLESDGIEVIPEMTLGQQSGGTPEQRLAEAQRIMEIISDLPTEQLSQRDEDFLTEMQDRLDQYGERCMVSTKQLFWLRDIKGKLLDM